MSKFPCVERFLAAVWDELLPTERQEALAEVAEFSRGYVGCKEEMWKADLAVGEKKTERKPS